MEHRRTGASRTPGTRTPEGTRTLAAARWLAGWRLALLAATIGLAAATPPATAAPERVEGGIRFNYSDPHASAVSWVGEFNAWNTNAHPMRKDPDGSWSIVLALPAGEHQYKFHVDGRWVADPGNPATTGESGNSAVRVGAAGELMAMKATSNTPYSPKIAIGGRMIGLYQASRNPGTARYELRRPDMDIDVTFDIRVSDALSARFLMNIKGETEDVELFRSRLNFDRGRLLLTRPRFSLLGFDNEGIGTWDDPLELVGGIGIYDHAFGYQRQGFKGTGAVGGFEAEVVYADNFKPGGNSYPGFTLQEFLDLSASTRDSLKTVRSGAGFVLDPDQAPNVTRTTISDNNENTIAARVRRALPWGLRAGLLGRTDRGFNLGSTLLERVTGPLSFQRVFGTFEQEWNAAGAEVAWSGPRGVRAFGEVLRGNLRMSFVNAGNSPTITNFVATGADANGITGYNQLDQTPGFGQRIDLDKSTRFRLGSVWTESHGDIVVSADVEYQDHAYQVLQHGIENSMTVWRLGWDRNWRHYVNREIKTTIGIEHFAFDYDPLTPWSHQFWFPAGNFWLENGEHLVRFDRLTLLGGDDVTTLRTGADVPIRELARRLGPIRLGNPSFGYRGAYNFVSLDRLPRYAESIFRFGIDLTPALRLNTDSRWAKYDDPRLQLFRGYLDHFGELVYRFAPGIDVALSFGVDPSVIDAPVNEYAPIGRDQFLFGLGANAGSAETNYFGLSNSILAAERALRAERRVQVKANVVF